MRLVVGETREALVLLQKNLDRQQPDDNLLNLLAGLHLKAERYDEAEELYRLGAQRHPTAAGWPRSLAKVYLAQGNDVKLAEVLAQLAVLDGDDLPVRKKLMQLALSARDFASASRWGHESLHIDVMDVEIHRMLAEAALGTNQFAAAADEYEVAVTLDNKNVSLQLALAEACLQAKRHDRAKQALDRARELRPGNVADD